MDDQQSPQPNGDQTPDEPVVPPATDQPIDQPPGAPADDQGGGLPPDHPLNDSTEDSETYHEGTAGPDKATSSDPDETVA